MGFIKNLEDLSKFKTMKIPPNATFALQGVALVEQHVFAVQEVALLAD